MKNEPWAAIHHVFERMEALFGKRKRPAPPLGSTAAPEGAEALAEAAPPRPAIPDLIRSRAEIRMQLDLLRAKLAEQLTERDCYLLLFPMVAHFDELIQTHYLEGDPLSWPPLQRELFQVDDAGVIFYEILDDILLKPQTFPLIYELFYFCLSDGFRGRYESNPAKIAEYLERLRGKIPLPSLEGLSLAPAEITPIEPVGSPAWYYGAAVGGIVAFYLLLTRFTSF